MDINPFTGEYWAAIMVVVIGALLGIGVRVMVSHAKWLGKTVLETRDEARATKAEASNYYNQLIARMENLPLSAMQSEIKSNSDNIRVLDKNLSRVDGRVSILERDFERIRSTSSDKNR